MPNVVALSVFIAHYSRKNFWDQSTLICPRFIEYTKGRVSCHMARITNIAWLLNKQFFMNVLFRQPCFCVAVLILLFLPTFEVISQIVVAILVSYASSAMKMTVYTR